MDIIARALLGVFLLTLSTLSNSDTFTYGIVPVVGIYKTSLDKDSEAILGVNVLSGLLIIDSGRNSRYWIQAQYHSLGFEGSETEIGQNVSGFEMTALYQSKFRFSRHFKPWLGVGLSITQLKFENRFTTDNQGFLAQRFSDTTETGFSVDFNFTVETEWFKNYGSGFSARASIPTNDVLGKIEAGVYITF